MNAFKPKPVEQQKKNYVKACKRQMAREMAVLLESFQEEFNRCDRLHFNRCRIVEKINKIQDRVANAADKEFGGWQVWRRDDALMDRVVKRMDAATARHRENVSLIDERLEIAMRPYHKACQKISNKYRFLMKTAR